MSQPIRDRAWLLFVQFFARIAAIVAFRIRCHDRDRVPVSGGGLMLANHQSHLDPIVIGLATNRSLNYLARQTLFDIAPLGWLMNSLGGIAIDREGTGLGGLKETLRRLKRGEMVLMFPEGTRTSDGEVQPLKAGFTVLAQRACVPIYPVGLDGTFDAWPRQRRLPRPAVVHVQFGQPIAAESLKSMTDEELAGEVERRIRECHEQARAARQLSTGQSGTDGRAGVSHSEQPPEGRG